MGAPEGRIVIYWTLVAEGGEMLACDLCRTSDGLHLRCVSDNGDVVITEFVGSAAEAIEMATAWKERYLAGHHWSERGTDWDREPRLHPAKARTVLEKKAEHRRRAS